MHWSRVDEVSKLTGDLSDKELAKRVPRAWVVAAFNTIPSEVLFSLFEWRGGSSSPDMLYYGDDRAARTVGARQNCPRREE